MIPKFRVWLKDVGEMVEVLEIDFYNKEVAYIWTEQVSDYELEQTREVDKFGDVILMQYTGLKDKNGVEIYEGDYIDCKWGYDDWSGVAEFIEGSFCTNPLSDLKFPSIINECSSIKVIGNIYENSNLIK